MVGALVALVLALGTLTPAASAAEGDITGRVVMPAGTSLTPDKPLHLIAYPLTGGGNTGLLRVADDGTFTIPVTVASDYRVSLRDYQHRVTSGYFDGSSITSRSQDAAPVPPGADITILGVKAVSITGSFQPVEGLSLAEAEIELLAYGYGADGSPRGFKGPFLVSEDGTFAAEGLEPGVGYELYFRSFLVLVPDGWYRGNGLSLGPTDTQARVVAPASGLVVSAPPSALIRGTVHLPEGYVWNWGDNPATGPVVRVFTLGAGGEPVYEPSVFWISPGVGAQPFVVGALGIGKNYYLELSDERTPQLALYYSRALGLTADRTAATPVRAGTLDVVLGPAELQPPLPDPAPVTVPVSGRASVQGAAKVGAKLRAKGPTAAVPGAKVSYQWLRDGTPVKGATSVTYRVKAKDVRTRLSARVRVAALGYVAAESTSARTGKVAKGTVKVIAKLKKKTVNSTQRARVVVTVSNPAVARPKGTVRVWFGKRSVKVALKVSAEGKVTVRLPRLAPGRYEMTAKFTPSGTSKKYLRAKTSAKRALKVMR